MIPQVQPPETTYPQPIHDLADRIWGDASSSLDLLILDGLSSADLKALWDWVDLDIEPGEVVRDRAGLYWADSTVIPEFYIMPDPVVEMPNPVSTPTLDEAPDGSLQLLVLLPESTEAPVPIVPLERLEPMGAPSPDDTLGSPAETEAPASPSESAPKRALTCWC